MAVKLGKYLRCLGYDAEWDVRVPTRELARRAAAEGRVLLTRNTRVGFELEPPARWLQLTSEDAVEQLQQVVAAFDLDVRAHLFSRCILCNVALETISDRERARGRVPGRVLERYETFYACPRCGTVFWKGTHVANTCRKLGIEWP
jgi:uncharacterized protein with PIN domain